MRFHKQVALAAVLTAFVQTTPFTAQADQKDLSLATMANLVVDVTRGPSGEPAAIRNEGGVASAACHVRVTYSTGETYELPVMELEPGAIQYLWLSPAGQEKPFSVLIEVDCDQEVLEAREDDNSEKLQLVW